ncbi:MAG: HD domain-containing protein [Alphaproteobacteria bacterium]|nr:HD domain-containing protein [Alphaproteobacteria bacterium]
MRRLSVPQPIATIGDFEGAAEKRVLAELGPGTLLMAGDNPALPQMPARPRLLDFYRLRFSNAARSHLLQSAMLARKAGHGEKIVLACLLHDIAMGALMRTDHGYWGAQLIAPYVDEEVAWAVRHHQALRFFPDPAVGYEYPQAYLRFWGPDYEVPGYLKRDFEAAREHRWYMSARTITLYDLYAFEDNVNIDPGEFEDLIGRHFKQPEEGLGFDNSPTAHMWRTMIWPDNFL